VLVAYIELVTYGISSLIIFPFSGSHCNASKLHWNSRAKSQVTKMTDSNSQDADYSGSKKKESVT